jgi:hypothetical protein
MGELKMMIRRHDWTENKRVRRGAKAHWTAEDKSELKRLAQTTNIYELARRFRRTPSAILSMAYKLGISITTKRKKGLFL